MNSKASKSHDAPATLVTGRHPGSLLKELDLDKEDVLTLLELARRLKRAKAEGSERQQLAGKNIALI